MATDNIDPEKDHVTATARSTVPSSSSSTPGNAPVNKPRTHTPIQLFQLLVGIHTPPSLAQGDVELGGARTDNIGLYRRTKQQERASRLAYLSTSFISNTLFLLQILLAATFTALSAYKQTQARTLTALGAVNTVLAGCLAWQKGQGVPQRYRKAQDQYQALLLEIEMAERSFLDLDNNNAEDGTKLDPRAEKDRLQKLFDTARADQQANYPDLYVSTGGAAAKDAPKDAPNDATKDAAKDSADLAKQLEDAKAETVKVQSEMMAKIEALMAKLASQVDAHVKDTTQSVAKA